LNSDERMAQVRAAFFAIQDCPLPVIGAVRGAALGAGLAIAASCDFIVATADARIGVPEVSVGVMGGARHLARLLPQPVVRLMYLTGEPLDVQRLFQLGAVVAVAEPDELLEVAHRHAGQIVRHSDFTTRMAKRSLNTIETMDVKRGYEFEQSLTRDLVGHPDSIEAVLAAIERRAPRYQGDGAP
jgi:enoyl-CoA hydratase